MLATCCSTHVCSTQGGVSHVVHKEEDRDRKLYDEDPLLQEFQSKNNIHCDGVTAMVFD